MTSSSGVLARLRTDPATLGAYVSDASIYRRAPQAVFEPRDVDDIRAALEIAREENWAVTVRGGGTSVAGNAIGEGLVIDTSRYFNQILDIDVQAGTARVEPGVICSDLQAAAGEHGLTFAPDPSTRSRCTIGGMIGNNACGAHSLKWGTTADNVIELTVMLPDGRLVTLRKGGASDSALEEALRELRDSSLAPLRTELGRFPRQVSGYGLHHLTPENGFDLAKAFVGSEGTCGIVIDAVVRLTQTPPATALAVIAYSDIFDAATAAASISRTAATTAEGMGGDLLEALRTAKSDPLAGSLLPGATSEPREAGGWLYCETGGHDAATARENAEALLRELSSPELPVPVGQIVVDDRRQVRQLWSIREEAAGLVTRLSEGREAWPSWEDSSVPPENLAAYLRDLYALLAKYELDGIPFGHFGEGCVHLRVSFDFRTTEGLRIFRSFMFEAARMVTRHGGSLSGEHGDGRARSELLPLMYSEESMRAFADFKRVFDPQGIFNPGVLHHPEPLDAGLRPRSDAASSAVFVPLQAFSRDNGSMVSAVDRCAGVGLCRTPANAMCPSFQITQDEVHSTRGRARLLSEMFRGKSTDTPVTPDAVKDALDLCLSCHACASECPVNVDMSTYKSEFLNDYYSSRRRPRSHVVMGGLPRWMHMLHSVPGLGRAATAPLRWNWVGRLALRTAGADPTRKMIQPAPRSFQNHFDTADNPENPRGTVVLFPDSFSNHFDTEVAAAATEVLRRLGFAVTVPSGFVCCGLTLHSTGQLEPAQRVLTSTLDKIESALDGSTPVVVLEPSCMASLLEAPELLPHDPRATALQHQVTSFGDLVASALNEIGPDASPFTSLDQPALSQVHCHERSRGGHDGTSSVLAALGVDEAQIETGCCGLAGNWGFEPGHGRMSLDLGERELFPRVRALGPDAVVLADGFSCRTQLEEGTGSRGLHLAQVLVRALDVPTQNDRPSPGTTRTPAPRHTAN
ncbi:FAD-binding and (Fe-S)-binding domain-containing protein [Dietzia maris]|uniref:FAD-binding and (Fe-S)-binding domain-containing protein n=1 Tax=Dietzia maris TaxID=37915 RepID=UPI00223B7B71|nr:FAD-binding and (Fe-S)-binding domain-containing protein [Dietzia maris]MCT1433491.1 FAD-binding oxidoreductase [Dietzia maris]MCT1520573.1 FAD-binding oxidoreductase [Dietzia maris]